MLLVSDLIFDEDVILSCHYTVYDCIKMQKECKNETRKY